MWETQGSVLLALGVKTVDPIFHLRLNSGQAAAMQGAERKPGILTVSGFQYSFAGPCNNFAFTFWAFFLSNLHTLF